MPGFAGREGAAAAAHGDRAPAGAHGGCTPHFLFETSKRKCAVHGGKEKMFVRLNLTPLCQVDRKTGVAVAGAVQICRFVPGALYPWGTEKCSAASVGMGASFAVYLRERRTLGFALVRLVLSPRTAVMHPPRSFGVGNPKGRGRSPSPLCRFKGVRGKSKSPRVSLWGARGDTSLFKREMSPCPLRAWRSPPPTLFATTITHKYTTKTRHLSFKLQLRRIYGHFWGGLVN